MSKIALDLKKFKHVKSDDKSTTLQHKDGHVLTVHHKSLSPEFQEQLKVLHKASGGRITKHVTPNVSEATMPMMNNGGDPSQKYAGHPAAVEHSYPADIHSSKSPEQEQSEQQSREASETHVSEPSEDEGYKTYNAEGGAIDAKMAPVNGIDATRSEPGYTKKKMAEGGDPSHQSHEQLAAGNPYEAGLPCLNPNCKSHGRPHPNCRCYSRMAKGGKVVSVCAMGSGHYPDCEYYSGGKVRKSYAEGSGNQEIAANDSAPKKDDSFRFYQPAKEDSEEDRNKDIGKEVEDAENFINPKQPQAAALPSMQNDANAQDAPPQQAGPSSPDADQSAAQQPSQAPAASQSNPPQGLGKESSDPIQRFATHKQDLQNDYLNEDNAWAQDLANGHITPLTYQSLFANNADRTEKSTLGRLGTIFGMLLSGGGSGLSHQPNALLAMMKQTIDNDLDAQKTSKADAVNYLRLSQQHEMNKANINSLNAETAIKANTLARMKANRAALHDLTVKASAYPPGSKERAAADANLAMLYPLVQSDNNNLADRAATAGAYYRMLGIGSDQNKPDSNEEAFQQQQRGRMMLGPQGENAAQMAIQRHIPGITGQASRPIPEDIRNRLQAQTVLDNKGQDVLNYVKQHTGTWNPQTRAVAQQKIEEMKNFYNDSIKGGALTQGRLGWYDEQFAKNPTDILSQLMGSTAKLKEMVNSNRNRRDLELSGPGGLGFPKQNQQQSSQQQFKEGATGTHNGKPTVFKGGKWVYQ